MKCSVPMPCTISSKCQHMRASQAVRSRESFGEDAWMADARRCCRRKSDASAAPPGRVGIRPRLSARSIRLPRRVPQCNRYFASKQTMLSERSSDWSKTWSRQNSYEPRISLKERPADGASENPKRRISEVMSDHSVSSELCDDLHVTFTFLCNMSDQFTLVVILRPFAPLEQRVHHHQVTR